ncbi:hypothetical protein NMY22_g16892 [Coprinellus aureogranulatus]|nr:hypothetical protein NMY22_g16892 [Coprinellus aureogranulatus]
MEVGFRITGMLGEPMLYVYDTKALYNILIKDTETFEEPDDFLLRNQRLFGMGLLSTTGETPQEIYNFRRLVVELRESLIKQVADGEKEVNINGWMSRMALEAVGQAGFGYSFDTLEPDAAEHPFTKSVKNIAPTVGDPFIRITMIFLFPYIYNLGSPRFQRAVVDLLPWKKLHELRDMVDAMHKTSIEIYEATKESLKDGQRVEGGGRVGGGKDIMSVLVKANLSASEEDRLTEDEMIGQISVLTFAAMDTTSNALSRILHVLSERPEAQDRLRQEILQAYEARGGQDPNYDELNALPFLDAVCKETLRLYTPAPYAFREAKKDGILPFGTPVKTTEGQPLSELFIPKDTRILISLRHCNTNPEIWGPDAAEWRPERWLAPLPETVTKAKVPGVYANLMTFLGGSRACIGFKFSELEMKVVLSLLIKSFHFSPGDKKVIWLWNGVTQPTTEDSPTTATGAPIIRLPLRMRAVKD